jgi:hypothetical protein
MRVAVISGKNTFHLKTERGSGAVKNCNSGLKIWQLIIAEDIMTDDHPEP